MPTVERPGQASRTTLGFVERKSNGTVVDACRCMMMASVLDSIGVDAGCRPLRGTSQWIPIATIIINVFQIEGMDVSGEVTGRYR